MPALEWGISVIGVALLGATWRLGVVTGRLQASLEEFKNDVRALESRVSSLERRRRA